MQWWQADFGPLAYGSLVRALAVSCTLVALALQLAFTAFLAAIIDIGLDATPVVTASNGQRVTSTVAGND